MRKKFTYTDLGSPTTPGIRVSTDGTRVNLDRSSFESWKAVEFRETVWADLVHPAENIGGAIYTVTMVGR